MLEEVTSGMRVEVGLISPAMAGIVVGLTTLIVTVLTSLSGSITSIQSAASTSSSSSVSSVVPFAFSMFNLSVVGFVLNHSELNFDYAFLVNTENNNTNTEYMPTYIIG